MPGGKVCGAFALTAGHISAKTFGGTDNPANLRAECGPHNYSEGGRIGQAKRHTRRDWTW
jgi:hypothetical protein